MMDDIRIWSGPIASLLAIISIIYTWLTARSKANEGKLASHERKLIEHDRRIQTLEGEVKHLPSKDDFNDLRLVVEQLRGDLGRLEASYEAIRETVKRIENFLVRGAERG